MKKYFNAKTGAVVGGLVGLALSTIAVTNNPQLNELPIDEKIKGVVYATVLMTFIYGIGFDIGGRVANKVNDYFDRLARR